jgi:hypothetical protein
VILRVFLPLWQKKKFSRSKEILSTNINIAFSHHDTKAQVIYRLIISDPSCLPAFVAKKNSVAAKKYYRQT